MPKPSADSVTEALAPPRDDGIRAVGMQMLEGHSPCQIARNLDVPLHRVLFFQTRIKARIARLDAQTPGKGH